MSNLPCFNTKRRCLPYLSSRLPRRPVLMAIIVMLLGPVAWSQGRSGSRPAAESVLVINNGANAQRFTAAQLLNRPDVVMLSATGDVYHRTVVYRAVPFLALLGNGVDSKFDTVEMEARDGFVSQIPLALIKRGAIGGSVAYIAVEDPAHPWPPLPQKNGDGWSLLPDLGQAGAISNRTRAMALSVDPSDLCREPGSPLASDRGARDDGSRRFSPTRTRCFCCAMPAVSSVERWRRERYRTRLRTPDVSDTIPD
jgi:hypothetical protein